MEDNGIYAIVNDITGVPYIGETSRGFFHRWHEHLTALEKGKHHCKRLQSDFTEYGGGVFSFQILEVIGEWEPKYDQELQWIGQYGGQGVCYNTPYAYGPQRRAARARQSGEEQG